MEKKLRLKKEQKIRRRRRVRVKVKGTAQRPRLSVFRGLKHLYLQLIDDDSGRTLVSVKDSEIIGRPADKSKKSEVALAAGKLLAEKALAKNIDRAVFDRGVYKYHGRVKAVADGARAGGLKF